MVAVTLSTQVMSGAIPAGALYKEGSQVWPPVAPGYADAVLADNPVLYWRCDEPTPPVNVADASGHGRLGTRVGPSVWGVPSPVGDGTAIRTTSTASTWIEIATFPGAEGPMLSYEFWWQRGSQAQVGFASPVLKAPGSWAAGLGCYFEHPWLYCWVGHYLGATAWAEIPETWTHIAVTYDQNKIRVYTNGVLSPGTSTPGPRSFDVDEPLQWTGGASYVTKGDFDEFAFYDHVLTPERIVAHYEAGVCDGGVDRHPDAGGAPRQSHRFAAEGWREHPLRHRRPRHPPQPT